MRAICHLNDYATMMRRTHQVDNYATGHVLKRKTIKRK